MEGAWFWKAPSYYSREHYLPFRDAHRLESQPIGLLSSAYYSRSSTLKHLLGSRRAELCNFGQKFQVMYQKEYQGGGGGASAPGENMLRTTKVVAL